MAIFTFFLVCTSIIFHDTKPNRKKKIQITGMILIFLLVFTQFDIFFCKFFRVSFVGVIRWLFKTDDSVYQEMYRKLKLNVNE